MVAFFSKEMTEKETREILTWLGKKRSAIAIPIQKII